MNKVNKIKSTWLIVIVVFLIFTLFLFLSPLFIPLDEGLKLILVILILSAIFYKIGRDKRTESSEIISFLSTLQSVLTAVLCSVIFTAILFWFDYWLVKKLGHNNSYACLLFGLLSAIASFLIILKNPKSIWYAPLIINIVFIISAFVGDFDPMIIPGWLITIITSWLGYRQGKKRINSDRP
jgi:hypothetical protein